jgi:hypothetical protein
MTCHRNCGAVALRMRPERNNPLDSGMAELMVGQEVYLDSLPSWGRRRGKERHDGGGLADADAIRLREVEVELFGRRADVQRGLEFLISTAGRSSAEIRCTWPSSRCEA